MQLAHAEGDSVRGCIQLRAKYLPERRAMMQHGRTTSTRCERSVSKRKPQGPRTTRAEKKAAIDAAIEALNEPDPLPRTAEEARNYLTPDDRLALILKIALDANARSAHPDGDERISDANLRLAQKLILINVDLSLGRQFDKARKNKLRETMPLTGIEPLPTVDAFVRWLRRRATK